MPDLTYLAQLTAGSALAVTGPVFTLTRLADTNAIIAAGADVTNLAAFTSLSYDGATAAFPDTFMAVPGGIGNFIRFGAVAIARGW